MTAKKTAKISYRQLWNDNEMLKARNQNLADDVKSLQARLDRLEAEANERLHDKKPEAEDTHQTIEGMARARPGTRRPPRHATASGPNFPDDIYPPGCGPLQLVWQLTPATDGVVIGIQGDSFHGFASRLEAVSWLMGIAQRIINDRIPER